MSSAALKRSAVSSDSTRVQHETLGPDEPRREKSPRDPASARHGVERDDRVPGRLDVCYRVLSNINRGIGNNFG